MLVQYSIICKPLYTDKKLIQQVNILHQNPLDVRQIYNTDYAHIQNPVNINYTFKFYGKTSTFFQVAIF